jgi:putative ABC transport system permease protein
VVFIVSLIPVWASQRQGRSAGLSGRGPAARSLQPPRWPVIAQAALACVLIVSAALLSQAFVRLANMDLGFVPNNVLTMRISLPRGTPGDRQTAYFASVLERLRHLPAVTTAGAVSDLPLAGNSLNVPVAIDGLVRVESDPEVRAAFRVITPGYLEAITAKVRGRHFDAHDGPASGPVAIVNDALAQQYWQDANPIGKRIRTSQDSEWRTVVGVVRDVHHGGLTVGEGPTVYIPHAQKAEAWMTWMSLAIRTSDEPLRNAATIRAAVAEVDRNQPVSDVMKLEQLVDDALALPRLAAFISTVVAGITLLLSAAGLASTLSLFVSARTPEFSVRLALGAVPSLLAWRTIREAITLVSLGAMAGFVVAFAAGRLMASLLHDVSAYDSTTFATALLILLATAVLTAIGPARSVARIDPSLTLRS